MNYVYMFPEYNCRTVNHLGLCGNCWSGYDDNYFDFGDRTYLVNQAMNFDCGTSYTWTPLSGYESACAIMNFYMETYNSKYFCTDFP